jgi:hypothetical protein
VPRVPFDQLPPDARLWIFPASRRLSDDEQARVLAAADAFIDQWLAHGVPLNAARDIRHNQFVLIGVDEQAAGASGCSIDALVRSMGQLQSSLGLELIEHGPVLYRNGGAIARVSREEFGKLASTGQVSLDTVVFDNTLARVADLRAGRWEVRAADSWHARAFF